MEIRLNMQLKEPIYEQIYNQIRNQVISDAIIANEKLPSTSIARIS